MYNLPHISIQFSQTMKSSNITNAASTQPQFTGFYCKEKAYRKEHMASKSHEEHTENKIAT